MHHNIFAMGSYGWYVWPAYFITLGVFGVNMLVAYAEKKNIRKIIKNYHE